MRIEGMDDFNYFDFFFFWENASIWYLPYLVKGFELLSWFVIVNKFLANENFAVVIKSRVKEPKKNEENF